jgi:hypothetical protein
MSDFISISGRDVVFLLYKYFSRDFFTVQYDTEKNKYIVSRVLKIPQKDDPDILEERIINCIEIYINHTKKEIQIDSILSCASGHSESIGRGTDIVAKIVEFTKREFPSSYKLIILFDVSRLTIHGFSWIKIAVYRLYLV